MALLTYYRKEQWVATQVFRGSALKSSRNRKKSLYNAYLHQLSKQQRNNDGELKNTTAMRYRLTKHFTGTMDGGRDALPDLAKAASEGQGWRGLPEDVCDQLIEQLERDMAEKAVVPLVSSLNIATHYETELEALVTDVSQ